jgi:hypothetical protein
MDINKTGGPSYPTLNGGQLDDKTSRWEGMTLFDYYVGQLLLAGKTPLTAVKDAAKVMEYRNAHLIGEKQ